jgi:hypothetical protein
MDQVLKVEKNTSGYGGGFDFDNRDLWYASRYLERLILVQVRCLVPWETWRMGDWVPGEKEAEGGLEMHFPSSLSPTPHSLSRARMPSDWFQTPLSAPFQASSARARTLSVPVNLHRLHTAAIDKDKHDFTLVYIRKSAPRQDRSRRRPRSLPIFW